MEAASPSFHRMQQQQQQQQSREQRLMLDIQEDLVTLSDSISKCIFKRTSDSAEQEEERNGNSIKSLSFENAFSKSITPKQKKIKVIHATSSPSLTQKSSLVSLVSPSISVLKQGIQLPPMEGSWHQTLLKLAELLKKTGLYPF